MWSLAQIDRQAASELRPLPDPVDIHDLEPSADALVARLRCRRAELASRAGVLPRWMDRVDRRLRTVELEHLDDPHFDAARKLRIVRKLHRLNRATFTYGAFAAWIEPLLREVAAQKGRSVRVLELASGFGGFALALARRAKRCGFQIEVTGSDIVEEYVVRARRRAAEHPDVSVRYEVLNAFKLDESLKCGDFDVIFIAQSLHHLSSGQLALMLSQSSRIATSAFVGVDGRRSLRTFVAVPLVASVCMSSDLLHDAWVSVRRFYSESELQLLAALAVPRANACFELRRGVYTIWTIRFRQAVPETP